MKNFVAALGLGVAVVSVSAAEAAEIQVKMLNKGAAGAMVFEPNFIVAAPGDTIKFVPVDKGHNVEAIKDMLPQGVELFKSKVSEEFTLGLDVQGVYGVKCIPHYAMGMVALIRVGDAKNIQEAMAVKQTGKAKKVFEALFRQIVASN